MRVLPLRVGVGWHPGVTRRHYPNEDSIVVLQGSYTYQNQLLPFGLFVVADGMGGHEDGQVASRMAMQTLSHTVLQNIIMGKELSDEFFTDMLVGGVEWANMAIYERGKADGVDMGTTLTAVLVINMRAYIVNVGDSRTYLFRDSAGLIQITRDHSLVASLVAFGQITPDEVYTHPDRSQIYRSLGQIEDLKVDSFKVDLQPHDRLLLCSDGLWEMVRDPAIERIIRSSNDPLLLSDHLVQTALRGGGCDNISVIIAQI
jgi:serine/threonine protein phosphatase PrpC